MSKRWSVGVWLLLALTGCGKSPVLVPVVGTVTHAGKALGGVEVVFVAEDGAGYKATTDAQGQYRSADKGMPPGRYVVLLREPTQLGKLAGNQQPGLPGDPARHAKRLQEKTRSRIPPTYSTRKRTPLRDVVVQVGQDRHDFVVPK